MDRKEVFYANGCTFKREPFVSLQRGNAGPLHGHSELLCKIENAEDFFSNATIPDILSIFKASVIAGIGHRVSVNIQPVALYDVGFVKCLTGTYSSVGDEMTKTVVEITEQAEATTRFDAMRLDLLKSFFAVALDDVNPDSPEDMERLHMYAPHVSIIKLPFQFMRKVENAETAIDACRKIAAIKQLYPRHAIVMEGVWINAQRGVLRLLHECGVDYAQVSSYGPKREENPDIYLEFLKNVRCIREESIPAPMFDRRDFDASAPGELALA